MNKNLSYDTLVKQVRKCTACETCMASCPKTAIEMKEDAEGFLRPFIHSDICIGCKKCLDVCPVLNTNSAVTKNILLPECYAGVHKNEDILLNSSSGGAFSALANEILLLGGHVYGAAYRENGTITHTKAASMEELHAMRGAKYAHSSAANAYKTVKKDLKNGYYVLFTGTPCQIVGLKRFLGQKLAESDLLYTCDIICHGMMPNKLYRDYLKYHGRVGCKVARVDFRYKEKGIKGTRSKLVYENGNSVIIPNEKDYYHDALVSDFCLRESCYNCQASQLPRSADFTIGDFWGVKEALPQIDDSAGVSIIFFHTEKAKQFITNLEKSMRLWEVSFNLAVKHNPSFWYSPPRYPIREQFLHRLMTKGYKGSVLHYFNRSVIKRNTYNIAHNLLNIFRSLTKRK